MRWPRLVRPTNTAARVLPFTSPDLYALAPVLMSLKECLTKAQGDPAVKAVVVTGAQGKFSAGFDITHLAKLQATGSQEDFGTDVNAFLIKLLEAGPKPSVAGAPASGGTWSLRHKAQCADSLYPTLALPVALPAIANVALGGGLEVAMACNARVVTKGAQLGLPELQLGAAVAGDCAAAPWPLPPSNFFCALRVLTLRVWPGIIPGFGGTARLPRLVGLEKGLTMMLRSKNIKVSDGRTVCCHPRGRCSLGVSPSQAEEALKSGLVDVVVAKPEDLLATAKALALDIANGVKPKVQALRKADKLPNMMARLSGGWRGVRATCADTRPQPLRR
jgi:enoyl-CoA hydratase/3-hydroxyacyl-CoA dehydrogenase